MKTPTIFLGSAFLALAACAPPSLAQASDRDGCVLMGNETVSASASAACRGGPLKAGDPRLGSAPVPRTSDRATGRGQSFQVGGSTVTISGSIRVEGVYAQ